MFQMNPVETFKTNTQNLYVDIFRLFGAKKGPKIKNFFRKWPKTSTIPILYQIL